MTARISSDKKEINGRYLISWKRISILFCTLRISKVLIKLAEFTRREKCPNMEFFLVRIFPHSDRIRSTSPYPVRMQENTNSVFGHFSRSVGTRKIHFHIQFWGLKCILSSGAMKKKFFLITKSTVCCTFSMKKYACYTIWY